MCGITGYLDTNKGVDFCLINKMNSVIAHRGPDDEGYAVFGKTTTYLKGKDTIKELEKLPDIIEQNYENEFLAFGHRRLSIIDITSAGHQPMCDVSKRYHITFNGEIYNYIELREELKSNNHVFTTNGDTEVILESYKEWGEDCVNHFNGMWAFAIYDRYKNSLFCSRDRLGAKPFYYRLTQDKFIFGSEIKQLCQDEEFDKKMNEQILMSLILFRISDYGEETLIKDIFSLPGGYNLSLHFDLEKKKIDKVNKYKYWDLKKGQGYREETDWYSLIRDSIKLRLRSDAPIGVMVSGGVDSSFLAGEICQYYKEQGISVNSLKSFTSCYNDAEKHDETYYAHLVNEVCGVEENLIYPDPLDTLDKYKKMVWHYEGYCTFSNLGSFLTLEQISKSGIKVLINGQGGDESMFGYERYYAYYFLQLFKECKFKRLKKEFKQACRNSRLSVKELIMYLFYFGSPLCRRIKNNINASKYVKKSLRNKFDYKKIKHILKIRDLDELIYNELRETQLTHILRYDDRGYMAFSMESRVPFIDYRYLEDAIRIEPKLKIQNGYTKYLIRKEMEKYLPDEVVWRTNKNGWSSPSERWVERFDKKELQNIFNNAVSACYFNVENIKNMYQKNPTCKEFEMFLVIELFMRQFNVSP